MRRTTLVLVVLLIAAIIFAAVALTSPTSSGGSYNVGPTTYETPVGLTSLVMVSQTKWDRRGRVRHVGHSITVVKRRARALSRATAEPCYRVEAEIHGDAKLIDKVVQGLGHFKLCMKAHDHTQVDDRYTSASSSHRETWMWDHQWTTTTKGAGVSTHWCNGGVGPCQPVEYRYWRFTFQWLQGVNIFGQTVGLHHKTLYIGCTLRAGAGGAHCGTGEA